MNTRASPTSAGGSLGRFYFVVWLALGAAGVFYATIATLAPDTLRSAEAGSNSPALEAAAKQVASLSATVGELRTSINSIDTKQLAVANSLASLRNDVGGIKVKLSQLNDTGQSAGAPQVGLDSKTVLAPSAKAVAQSAAITPAAPDAIEGVVVPDPNGTEVSSEAAADGGQDGTDPSAIAVIHAPAKTAAKTAAKSTKVANLAGEAKPTAAKPSTVKAAAARPYAIDLAMSTSPDALRQSWQLFQEQHGDLLAGLSPRSVTSGGNVRLLAGPFANQAAAVAHCAKLRKEAMSCSPTPLAGTPL